MAEEATENLDSSNQEENLDSNQESTEEVEETPEVLKEKLSKAEEISRNQKIRAERAEQELKALKKQPAKVEKETPKNDSNLSLKDIRALQDVHDDEVEEITEFAKFKGISVAEAKKNPIIQTLLKTREEERKIALAANVAGAKRGPTKVSDETVLEDFEKGIVSDKVEDIQKLVEAQFNRRKALAKAATGN